MSTMAAVVLVLITAPAAARADDDVVAAANAYSQAQQAELESNFARAAHLYELADHIAPSAQALRSAARARLAAGDHAIAATHAAALRKRYPRDAVSLKVAARVLAKLRPKLARVRVTCGAPCTIAVGRRAATTRRRRSHLIFVAPGKHVITARFADKRIGKQRIRARAGTDSRVELEAPPPQPPPGVSSRPSAQRLDPLPPPAPPRSRGLRTRWFWTGIALTTTLGAASLWSGLDTLKHRDAYERAPSEVGLHEGEELELRTNILLGATAAASIVTLILALKTDWRSYEKRVEVSASAGGVMVSLGGGF